MRGACFLTICIMLVACGGDDDSGGGNGDAAVAAFDIDKPWGFTQGPHEITGTITLPAALQSGRGIQLNIIQVSPGSGNTIDFATLTATKSMVTYRARGLSDGSWSICLRADVNGNNLLNDTGVDYTGCFDGTTAAPITMTNNATPIVLGGMNQSGKDFGLGTY
jgi:hypothetical protein